MRTLLYEAANVMLTPLQGPAQAQGLGLRHRQAMDHGKAHVAPARRLAIVEHACAGRNSVHLGVGLRPLRQETASSSRKERCPREGTDDGVDFVASGITGRLRFQPCRPVKRARRERRHPKASITGRASPPSVCGAIMRRCRRAAGCRPRLLAIPPFKE